jgi:hypothetical protein
MKIWEFKSIVSKDGELGPFFFTKKSFVCAQNHIFQVKKRKNSHPNKKKENEKTD